MDIKSKIQELVEKIQKDPQLRAAFKENPIKAVETLLGVDLPDDVVNQIVEGVKAKITLDKAGELLGGLKKLF
jgi:hypothetical protein